MFRNDGIRDMTFFPLYTAQCYVLGPGQSMRDAITDMPNHQVYHYFNNDDSDT